MYIIVAVDSGSEHRNEHIGRDINNNDDDAIVVIIVKVGPLLIL